MRIIYNYRFVFKLINKKNLILLKVFFLVLIVSLLECKIFDQPGKILIHATGNDLSAPKQGLEKEVYAALTMQHMRFSI
jgi:hypothetical protein